MGVDVNEINVFIIKLSNYIYFAKNNKLFFSWITTMQLTTVRDEWKQVGAFL